MKVCEIRGCGNEVCGRYGDYDHYEQRSYWMCAFHADYYGHNVDKNIVLKQHINILENEIIDLEKRIDVIIVRLKDLYNKQGKYRLASDRVLVDAGIVGED